MEADGGRIDAIQFRFPNGIPADKWIFGRVHVVGVGWLKTLSLEDRSVLGTTKLKWSIDAIQLTMVTGGSGTVAERAAKADLDFNLLLPPGSPPVPAQVNFPQTEPGLGRWLFTRASDEFSLMPDGTAVPFKRPRGTWTSKGGDSTWKQYVLTWEKGKWVDTVSSNWDASMMAGNNQKGDKMQFTRVDGLSQLRSKSGDGSYRLWTEQASGRSLLAILREKSADGARIRVQRKDNGVFLTLKTAELIASDRDCAAAWIGPLLSGEADVSAAVPEAKPKGIVLAPPRALQQSKGGFSIQIDELGKILSPYDKPLLDLDPHPDAVIYEGTSPNGGECRITYLMPRAKAEELLLGRAGMTMKLKAVAPGFPEGLSIHNYDRKFGDYDHVTLVVDEADQVVSVLFKSDRRAMEMPAPTQYRLKTLNYVNLKAEGGGLTRVRGPEKGSDPVVVNISHARFRETVNWFIPRPLGRIILFNVEEKRKARE